MGDRYISFHCPNIIGQDRSCNHFLAGPSETTIASYDFSEPWKDIRYCGSCRRFVEITILGKDSVPQYKLLPKGSKINVVPDTSIWGVFSITEEQA